MSWWDIIGLTPVAAWDSTRTDPSGTTDRRIIDGVGGYHMTGIGQDVWTPDFNALRGTNNPLPFTAPISMPSEFTVAWFARTYSRYIGFYKELNSGFILDRESTAGVWFSNTGSAYIDATKPFGQDNFLVLSVDATNGKLYNDGVLAPGTIPLSHLPLYLKGSGWTGPGNDYNLSTDDLFYGAAIWQGAATPAQVLEIQMALKTAIPSRIMSRRVFGVGGVAIPLRTPYAPLKGSVYYPSVITKRLTGSGYSSVKGTVREDGAPAQKYLRLYERATHAVRGGMWSRADGTYEFGDLSDALEYYVLVFDGNRVYPAQIQDQIVFPGP